MTTTIHSPMMFIWFGLVLMSSVGLYRTSDRVQHLDRELRQLNASIENEQQSLHVLKAEWIYLSNPARLEAAARKHLALRPTSLQQITSLDQAEHIIPARGTGIAAAPSAFSASASIASPSAAVPARKIAPSRIAAAVSAPKTTAKAAMTAAVVAVSATATSTAATSTAATSAAATTVAVAVAAAAAADAPKPAAAPDDEEDGISRTASAQPLPDSINALLERMESHP